MEFTTKIENGDVDIYSTKGLWKYLDIDKDTELDDRSITATVKWSVEIEAREWGIKGIYSSIGDISVNGDVEYYDVDDEECEDKIYKEFSCEGFSIIDEMELNGDMLCPSEIEIDFEKKTITVK